MSSTINYKENRLKILVTGTAGFIGNEANNLVKSKALTLYSQAQITSEHLLSKGL